MRELPPEDELLRPRDHESILTVPAQTWHCLFCDPDGPTTFRTTVVWMGPNTTGPHGRCAQCGQKYALAADPGMLLRDALPPIEVEHRLDHCRHCTPTAEAGAKPTVAWRGLRGRCARCGQAYVRPQPEARAA